MSLLRKCNIEGAVLHAIMKWQTVSFFLWQAGGFAFPVLAQRWFSGISRTWSRSRRLVRVERDDGAKGSKGLLLDTRLILIHVLARMESP